MPVSLDKDLFVPVNLRKSQLPAVIVYADAADQGLAKQLWNFVGKDHVRFLTPQSREELLSQAPEAALIFINILSLEDKNFSIAYELSGMANVVADVIAITPEQDIRKRLQIMSQQFDGIYNREILDLPEFEPMFAYKLNKGIRRLKARLQEDEYQTFKGFLSASADAFIVFDKDKRIFFVSEHYLKVYPKSSSYFVRGMPVQKAFEAVANEMGITTQDPRYQKVKDFWFSQEGQYEFMFGNGKVLRMTAVPLPDNQGTLISTTDITELTTQKTELAFRRKEAEIALIREQEANNLQKQFISMVSHEFRTPLTIVDGNAQILERRGRDIEEDESKRRLHTIRSAVSRLVHMMEAVLSSSMLRTGKLDLEFEHFNLAKLLETLCDDQRGLTRDHNIVCITDKLPETVYLDKKVVTLIFTNLISNAVKYTREAPDIHIVAFQDEDQIVVTVSDNGVGIPENELSQVFDRFFRATTAGNVTGTGIGLSLVQELVHLHKGFVKVESTIGMGTIFEVRLPIITESNQEPGDIHD